MAANYRITLDFDLDSSEVGNQLEVRALADHLCSVLYARVDAVVDVHVHKVDKLD